MGVKAERGWLEPLDHMGHRYAVFQSPEGLNLQEATGSTYHAIMLECLVFQMVINWMKKLDEKKRKILSPVSTPGYFIIFCFKFHNFCSVFINPSIHPSIYLI